MRFLLLLGADTTVVEDYDLPGCAAWSKEMAERGLLVGGMGLHPPDTASTVRVRGGEVLHTDGPFAETKEQMGGLTIIECADRDEALRVASTHPWAAVGMIEVRQVLD
ncbi:MAG: YciI family protein [Actinophytocola sp.]|uniref:YciI family protein n=1 Tax=Actinophytocola sp. TaxID=1872138 RepID=UPI003D6BBA2E